MKKNNYLMSSPKNCNFELPLSLKERNCELLNTAFARTKFCYKLPLKSAREVALSFRESFIKKVISFFLLGFLFAVFISCATKPTYSSKFDLYGIVVDENNEPVEDFLIECRPKVEADSKKRSKSETKSIHSSQKKNVITGITEKNGLFALRNLSEGEFIITGSKIGYSKISDFSEYLDNPQKMICIQVCSIEGVLENAKKLASLGNYKKALELLWDVTTGQDTSYKYAVQSFIEIIEKMIEGEEYAEI